jgi:hypothetical protein
MQGQSRGLNYLAARIASLAAPFAAMEQVRMDDSGFSAYDTIATLAGEYSTAPYRGFRFSSIAELSGEIAPSPDLDTQLLLDHLFTVSRLDAGWDGEKAQPASHVALKNAALAIIELYNRPSPDIALLDSGGILFEWNFPEITYQIEWFGEGGGEYSAFSKEAILREGPMPESTLDVQWALRELAMTNYLPARRSAALPA